MRIGQIGGSKPTGTRGWPSASDGHRREKSWLPFVNSVRRVSQAKARARAKAKTRLGRRSAIAGQKVSDLVQDFPQELSARARFVGFTNV